MRNIKIIVEKNSDGYVAYPLDICGAVVGEGETFEEAFAEVKSAIHFHVEAFGPEVIEREWPVLEAFVAQISIVI